MTRAHPPSERERGLIELLRSISDELPEVREAVDKFGHTSIRVTDRPLAFVSEGRSGDGSISVKTDLPTQELLLKTPVWVRTPYIGQHGWVTLAEGEEPDRAEIRELVRDAYRLVAPRRLARRLESD